MSDEENTEGNEDGVEEDDESLDWQLPLCFMKKRHKEKIEGSSALPLSWKPKERMRTVSVALVLCLNIGVDPPDVVKTSPCARMECWIDPTTLNPQKALDAIGNNLQQQYERWQPRARYRSNLDPTVEDVKKLCTSLRRNAKEDRVLFHYNGHGVPRPTLNGEIWVFNKQYTQYIPLSIYDLQTWMGSPSIYIYDCSSAGLILDCFKQFAQQREQDYERALAQGSPLPTIPLVRNYIQLAACSPNELLPMLPELPADLFTSCLTTPLKVALRWFVSQRSGSILPGITLELIDKIPGQLSDRRTPLGELQWIYTAITDTIAWNTLPRELFFKLYREDIMVAGIFRNFLLAERVMRSYNCTPVSCPSLPSMYHNPMWQAWDLAVDQCLAQLPVVIEDESKYKHSSFFSEQLTAFQVWLAMGNAERSPPEQLPIVLQVLLSQVHRLRALDLLGRFLDLGPWAVDLALSVGIFPYVLKLLQSTARELRPLMVFIWAKILAVDSSHQAELVDIKNGHKYFLSVLNDPYMPAEHRTTSSFVLARIIHEFPAGQEACLKGNMISICLEQLTDPHPLLRQWLALCLGLIWSNYDTARWVGIRDSAPDKLSILLSDPLPEVRAAAVFALGRLIANAGDRSDHANMVDHGVATTLASTVGNDGSPVVRQELVVAFNGLIAQFEHAFSAVAVQFLEEDRQRDILGSSPHDPETKKGWILVAQGSDSTFMTSTDSSTLKKSSLPSVSVAVSSQSISGKIPVFNRSDSLNSTDSGDNVWIRNARTVSSSSSSSLRETVYTRVWKVMLNLSIDPYPKVAEMAKKVVNTIAVKATINVQPRVSPVFNSLPSSPNTSIDNLYLSKSILPNTLQPPRSAPGTPDGTKINRLPTEGKSDRTSNINLYRPHSIEFSAKRKMFDKGPDIPLSHEDDDSSDSDDESSSVAQILVTTQFYEWCCSYFAQSLMKTPDDLDPSSPQRIEREWRFLRNTKVRQASAKQLRQQPPLRFVDEIFINKNAHPPSVIKYHPYQPHLAVADKFGVSIWNYVEGSRVNHFQNGNPKTSRITSMDLLNAHDLSLLLTATDDGAVRVWRNYCDDDDGRISLVTAWTALSGMIPSYRGSGSGLVTDWEQQSGMLLASGDVRIIRIWDAHREMKVQDIPTGADSCVTSLACDPVSQSLIVAGLGDGSVRLYDRRLPPTDCRVMTLREHQGWVVNVILQRQNEGQIISGSLRGDIKFWDPKMTSSVRTIPTTVSSLTCMDVHQQADLIACGSANQSIKVMSLNGELLNTIRYHDGFIGQRIGPLCSLAFHPYWPFLAAGSTDSFLSMYASEKPTGLHLEGLGII